MKTAEFDAPATPALRNRATIRLPLGLLGFEPIKSYTLIQDPIEAPFMWLQMLDNANLAFLVVSAEYIPEYQPNISQQDVEFLELAQPEDALLLNIVTLHPNGRATANLKGPVVVNRHTGVSKQVIPMNVADFPVHHPLGQDL